MTDDTAPSDDAVDAADSADDLLDAEPEDEDCDCEDEYEYEPIRESLWRRKKTPLTERTRTKGLFEFDLPLIGGGIIHLKWPATNRSAMVTLCVFFACVAAVIIVASTVTIWLIASGDPDNISQVFSVFGQESKDEQLRPPERVKVRTDDGIEIIEVCPPCDIPNCEDECPCPPCPMQLPCPVCPTMTKLEPIGGTAGGEPPDRSP